jgi:DNA-binding CsgD family transcriptional regulator/N-acetylneuraminic acid mutarotase
MPDEPRPLTPREIEVLRLVAQGATNQQIAHELVISINTVKVHLRNIFEKLEVESRTEATLCAIQEGLIELEGIPTPAAAEVEAPAPTVWDRFGRWAFLLASGIAILALVAFFWTRARTQERTTTSVRSAAMTASATRWAPRAPLPTARANLAVASYAGHVYAIGGENASGVTGVVERYDPTTDRWTPRASKPTLVTKIGAAVIGGQIYVPGGCLLSGEARTTVEIYDPEGNSWEERAPLPTPLCAYAITALEGKLYVFGGWDGTRFVDTVYEYDPDADRWTAKRPMPTARGYAGAGVVEGQIHVIGGYDGQRDLAVNEVYDSSRDNGEENPWTIKAPLPQGRGGLGVAAVGSTFYVIGGGWEAGLATSEQYDVRQDAWTSFQAPTSELWRNLGLAVVDTKIYALGGWDGDALDANREYTALFRIFLPGPP